MAVDIAPLDEMGMRDFEAPTPDTVEELAEFVRTLVEREHDYGTCVYAMSLAAVAAFNHVARKLGVTGFQASCADLDILKRIRHMEGPFIVLDGANLLYPQYDLRERLDNFINSDDTQQWVAQQAKKLLDEHPEGDHTHPNVRAHWERLAEEADVVRAEED